MSLNIDWIKNAITKELGIIPGHIEFMAPGVDPKLVYNNIGKCDKMMMAVTKGYTYWLIKDTNGNNIDLDVAFADAPWDLQIKSMKQANMLDDSHQVEVA